MSIIYTVVFVIMSSGNTVKIDNDTAWSLNIGCDTGNSSHRPEDLVYAVWHDKYLEEWLWFKEVGWISSLRKFCWDNSFRSTHTCLNWHNVLNDQNLNED